MLDAKVLECSWIWQGLCYCLQHFYNWKGSPKKHFLGFLASQEGNLQHGSSLPTLPRKWYGPGPSLSQLSWRDHQDDDARDPRKSPGSNDGVLDGDEMTLIFFQFWKSNWNQALLGKWFWGIHSLPFWAPEANRRLLACKWLGEVFKFLECGTQFWACTFAYPPGIQIDKLQYPICNWFIAPQCTWQLGHVSCRLFINHNPAI